MDASSQLPPPRDRGPREGGGSTAEALRKVVDGGKARITSATKVGPPDTTIDVPLSHKDALSAQSHYDAMEVRVPDAPLLEEIVVIVSVASGALLNARVGGLPAEETGGEDGLR